MSLTCRRWRKASYRHPAKKTVSVLVAEERHPILSDSLFFSISHYKPKQLVLSGCRKNKHWLSNSSLELIGTHLQELSRIDLGYCPTIDDEGIRLLFSNALLHLQSFAIRGNANITSKGLQFISGSIQNLQFCSCPSLTDGGLMEEFMKRCKLKSVSFQWCQNISDEIIQFIAMHQQGIEYIDVSGAKITDQGLTFLTEHPLPNLKVFHASSCNISDNVWNRVVAKYRGASPFLEGTCY